MQFEGEEQRLQRRQGCFWGKSQLRYQEKYVVSSCFFSVFVIQQVGCFKFYFQRFFFMLSQSCRLKIYFISITVLFYKFLWFFFILNIKFSVCVQFFFIIWFNLFFQTIFQGRCQVRYQIEGIDVQSVQFKEVFSFGFSLFVFFQCFSSFVVRDCVCLWVFQNGEKRCGKFNLV